MKNYQYFIPLFACVFAFAACQKDDDTMLERSNSEIRTSDEAVLSWKDCYDFTNYDMTVCFASANEYRCPCDVTCVWAGSVEYTLKVRMDNQETIVTLQPPGNPNDAPSSAVVGKAKISIEEAQPVNCADYGNFEKYQLKVTVTDNDPNTIEPSGEREAEFRDKVSREP